MATSEQPKHETTFTTIGQRRLAYAVVGAGAPTVILEAGLGGTIEHWRNLPRDMSDDVRVFSYDRAGLGASDPGPLPRTSDKMVADLHALLQEAQIPGPYVLVGHSLGGLNVRLYAAQYPDLVVGLVLLDPTPPGFQQRQLAVLPAETPGESAMLTRWRTYLARDYFDPETNMEHVDMATCCRQVAAVAGVDDRPMILINGGRGASWTPDFPHDAIERLEQARLDSRQEVLAAYSNARHIIAEGSGHYIHHDRPDLVLTAVRDVVEAARTHTRFA